MFKRQRMVTTYKDLILGGGGGGVFTTLCVKMTDRKNYPSHYCLKHPHRLQCLTLYIIRCCHRLYIKKDVVTGSIKCL